MHNNLEAWNPGKLPQGMTIAKLTKEHTSNPVNPVLAHPVYLSGYIEQMGTGTTDIIDHCLEYGLRKPEFHQDDDFRVVLWRPEVQERVQEGGEVDDKKKRHSFLTYNQKSPCLNHNSKSTSTR